MATDPVLDYLDALKNLDAATLRAERVVEVIIEAALELQSDWRSVAVSDTDVIFPPEIVNKGSDHTIDSWSWPTPQELAETLAGWHSAFAAARYAWRHVPESDRPGLRPLPSSLPSRFTSPTRHRSSR